MPEEFEGDLTASVFWGADLTGATFRDVNLTDVTISHAWLVNVDIDALIDRVVVNGVDVTEFVNERDPWYPLRAMLRPATPVDMRATWAALEAEWAITIGHARSLTDDRVHQSIKEEFSFVQTLRHLVMAMDKWFTAPILDEPFDPIALPNKGSLEFPFPGIDPAAQPTFDDVLAVRAARSERLRDFLEAVAADDFARSIDVLENGPHPLVECLYTVFEEEFWHLRYARRDLAILTG
ncbi:MAG: pentapeptide repeat-containing protein [Ilumatobacteraceae bacterium]